MATVNAALVVQVKLDILLVRCARWKGDFAEPKELGEILRCAYDDDEMDFKLQTSHIEDISCHRPI